jgi:hypothetical protein
MIIDTQATFSTTIAADGTRTGQPITATAISANVIDRAGNLALFPALEDEGLTGPEVWLEVRALNAAAGGDAAKTLTITLESAADAGLTSGPVVHYSSGAITGAAIIAGSVLARIQVPSADYKRYVGLRYTVSAGFTAFNVFAGLVTDVQANKTYPSGFTLDA